MRNKRLMRTFYLVEDVFFSSVIPDPDQTGMQIVAVDWSDPNRVCVTYLVDAD